MRTAGPRAQNSLGDGLSEDSVGVRGVAFLCPARRAGKKLAHGFAPVAQLVSVVFGEEHQIREITPSAGRRPCAE